MDKQSIVRVEKLVGILKCFTQLSSSISFNLCFEMGVKGFAVGIKGAKLKSRDSMSTEGEGDESEDTT